MPGAKVLTKQKNQSHNSKSTLYYNNRQAYHEEAAAKRNLGRTDNTKVSRNQIAIDRRNAIANDNERDKQGNIKTYDIKHSPITGTAYPGENKKTTTKDTSSPYNAYRESKLNRMQSQNWELTEPQPNVLHQFASYNTLFTLSALTESEIRNPKAFFSNDPHDIIAQSSGITSAGNRREGPPGVSGKKTVEFTNEKVRDHYNNAQLEFQKNNDIYFKNVEIDSVPGYNEKRRLTSVTKIQLELVEPYGLTLLEKVKAAAANNGYIDHVDAPYMLTIEFKGFDENGKPLSDNMEATKRVIPIKLTNMDVDVNQGGTYYSITAIPYNEFGFSNLYVYPRTSGTLSSSTTILSDAVAELEKILNDQGEQETLGGFNSYPDQYQITIDERLKPEKKLNFNLLAQVGMTASEAVGNFEGTPIAKTNEFIRFGTGQSVMKILENLMKAHPDFESKKFEEWEEKVKGSGSNGDPNDAKNMYFNYFRINATIQPMQGKFDYIRQTEQKKVMIVVEPYKVSAYNLVTGGIHQGKNMNSYIAKAYNYIFTGENIDILNLDINYKVAYYQSKLKNIEVQEGRAGKVESSQNKTTGTPTRTTAPQPKNFLNLKTETGVAKTSGSNRSVSTETRLDQFFDVITHPTADMVNIKLEIMGDPAWLGQSQFIPSNPRKTAPGVSTDLNGTFFTGGDGNLWNSTLKCYNTNVAESIINLTFTVPDDINDQEGVYHISQSQRATFSGLYKVYQVRSMVSDGKFTQELSMARFNNQDTEVTRGVSNKKINVSKGKITNVNPHKDSGDINRNVPDRMMGKIGQKIKKSKAYKRIQGFY